MSCCVVITFCDRLYWKKSTCQLYRNHEVYTKGFFVWKIAVGSLLCTARLVYHSQNIMEHKTSHIVCLFFLCLDEKSYHAENYFSDRVILKYLLLFQVYIKHAIHMKDLRGRNSGLAEVGLVEWMSASHGTGAPSLTANNLPHVCTSEF